MYALEVKEDADRIFKKLAKKNPKQIKILAKKIKEIQKNPVGYKALRKPLHGFNRVHIDSSFVLIFQIDDVNEVVTLYYYGHHDTVYQWRPKD